MKFKGKWYFSVIEKLILVIFLVWTVVPIYIIISNGFRRTLDIKTMPPELFFKPIFSHFEKVLINDNFMKYFFNSAVVAISTSVIVILLGTFTAYGILIYRSKFGEYFSVFMILGKLVPTITILIPLYIMMNKMGLTGTYFAPIIAHSAIQLPFITWLMLSFMRGLPKELLEASKVMGCSRMKSLFLIIFPLLKPAVGSAIILTMQYSWNELMFALQLTNIKTYTLTVAIAKYTGALSVDWGKTSAAAAITMVPIIIIGFFMQKYLVTGLTAGSVKG
ncbi:carbohydrate ABC transporter permease [Petrocella sp. FN5]|uniref:carbohydrate ABC transporter permease n=1 Tax=Petrocella sp. FN5 TaxID=3032002 RepID=UPI0023DBA856|nr:carbohydrate ABC transporter permease [Petrocella sp. FN5]MDF1618052.1 carbohydrate ABC transporter permease [Petrocella sp. FN5]